MSHLVTYNCKSQKGINSCATDNTGQHTVVGEMKCDQNDCTQKTCPKPCSDIKQCDIGGHYTHKPIAGSTYEYLGPVDYTGKTKAQYYSRSQTGIKSLSKEDLQDLTEDDLQRNKKGTDYANSTQDIINKLKK